MSFSIRFKVSIISSKTTSSIIIEVVGVTTYSVLGKIGNCLDEETINVIIKPMPTAVIDANKTSINTHDSIFFYSSGSVGSNYMWDFKDGYSSVLSNPYHTFDFPGAYQVKLTVEMGGCDVTDSLLIYVGTVSINDVLTHYGIASIPFGGEGLSGIGRMHGKEGLRSLSRTKSIVINRFNFINEIWWMGRSKRIENFLNKAIDFLYK